jgi:hypothetical protein
MGHAAGEGGDHGTVVRADEKLFELGRRHGSYTTSLKRLAQSE